MKVLFIDISLDGHHLPYLKELINIKDIYAEVFIPNRNSEINCKQIEYGNIKFGTKNFFSYIKWISKINMICRKNNYDIIHFLYGDIFYHFFGIRLKILKKIKKAKVIVTFHHIRRSFLHDISLKLIFKSIDKGIVHSKSLLNELNDMGINNVEHIEYPKFNRIDVPLKSSVLKKLSIPKDVTVLGAIGEIRWDKGLDILLEALKYVNEPFYLLVAGKPIDFNEDFIKEKIKPYENKVMLKLKYLSEDELLNCLIATDIIVLPYRKIFDGASGPLTEGVYLRKTIIAPNHGSLGYIVEKNNLGMTFESENIKSLSNTLSNVILNPFLWNDDAEKYRFSLDPINFKSKYMNIYKGYI